MRVYIQYIIIDRKILSLHFISCVYNFISIRFFFSHNNIYFYYNLYLLIKLILRFEAILKVFQLENSLLMNDSSRV